MTKETTHYVGKLGDGYENDEDESSGNLQILFNENKVVLVLLLIGLILIGLGVVVSSGMFDSSDDVMILGTKSEDESGVVIVEVSGAVESSGIYELDKGSRVDDALTKAGGLTDDADTKWMEKVLNRASLITDGQKIYIPEINDSNQQSGASSASNYDGDQTVSSVNNAENGQLVNINETSANQLESLWGIGRITAQNIIEQRPYSTVEELLTRKIIKSNVYERNKDLMRVY